MQLSIGHNWTSTSISSETLIKHQINLLSKTFVDMWNDGTNESVSCNKSLNGEESTRLK